MTIRLRYLPDYSTSNPYQSMLYSQAEEFGVDVAAVPIDDLDVDRDGYVDEWNPAASPDGSILHLHFTNPIVQKHTDPAKARAGMRRILKAITRYQERGAHFVWTVHSVMPHDYAHHALELELCRHLAAMADVVHVLTPSTLRAVDAYYPIDPAKVITEGHSSFLGLYPDATARPDARAGLGLATQDEVIASVGGVRPYRGLERLAEAVGRLQATRPRVRLIVAGRPGRGTDATELARVLDAVPGTIHLLEFMPGDELQLWMRAADVAAMPYERILNSSSLPLALTFGLPVVAPNLGVFHDQRDETYLHLYPAGSTDGLVTALDEALRPHDLAERSAAAHAAAKGYRPEQMSRSFFTQLLRKLDLALPPAAPR